MLRAPIEPADDIDPPFVGRPQVDWALRAR
jgi:hypothetical protein